MAGRRRVEASHTGDASAGPGGYANTGVHIGDVYLSPVGPLRSGYLHQVRRIAPPELLARDRELAELAAFCQDPAPTGAYRWWRAPAWSGKTALMSWFVLNPPPKVRIVSFFVTARLVGQSGRTAFVDNVLEQLEALVGGPAVIVTDSSRTTRLLGLLDTAAHTCRAAGETLVLLVDGLDEDQGADAEAGEDRSIAALLPVEPPAGMRVIVAGRPNPPIPADVPEHHPLRSAAVVRSLTASAAAQVVRADMERELSRLLHGTSVEQDLLGLLVAAGGGLTGDDLAELTGRTRQQVEDQLRTVAGRSFTRRDSRLRPGELADLYLLGHEELHVSVVAALGDERLATCRRRLHEWADSYRDRGWPAETPEYLLHGYHSLLLASGDLGRAVDLCTDSDRHDRVLDVSGGDAHAVDEITATLDALATREPADLAAMARLAVHRGRLHGRGAGIPAELPALWVALGFHSRAASLARSIGTPRHAMKALPSTAEALFAAGQSEHALQVVDHLVGVACAEAFVVQRDAGLITAAQVLAKAGEFDRAAAVARLVDQRGWLREGFLEAAGELADSGAHEQARAALRHVESLPVEEDRTPAARAEELANVARVLAVIGERARARELAKRARELSLTPGDPDGRARAAPAVVRCLNALGARRRARRYARKATLLMTLRFDEYDDSAVHKAVLALIEAGLLTRARSLTRAAAASLYRGESVKELAVAHARRGDHRTAAHLVTWSKSDSEEVTAWFEVASALARRGDHARAWTIAFDLRDRLAHWFPNPGRAMLEAVRIFCATGDVGEAEATALRIPEHLGQDEGLVIVAEALVVEGLIDRAEALLRRVEAAVIGRATVDRQTDGYLTIAEALVGLGELDDARVIGDRLPEPIQRARLLHAEVTAGVAGEDAGARLIELAERVEQRNEAAQSVAWAAGALMREGDVEQAYDLLAEAEDLIDGWRPDDACGAIAVVLARAGEPRGALEVVLRHEMTGWKQLLEVLMATGEPELARELVREADSLFCRWPDPGNRMLLRAELVEHLVAVGEVRRAHDTVDDLVEHLRVTPDPKPGSGDAGLARLAQGVFALHNPDEAPYVVERVLNRLRRDAKTVDFMYHEWIARPLALARVRAGDLDGALELAPMITEAGQRAAFLLEIAAALLREGDRHTPRLLIAEAMRLSEGNVLSDVVSKIGGFLPEVVRAAGAEVAAVLRR